MTTPVSAAIAARIAGAFSAWHTEFRGMTRRARGRFARREWQGGQDDAAGRLASYQQWVERFVETLGVLPPNPRAHWSRVRDAFGAEFTGSPEADLAATFFNSVTRRLLGTIGSDPHAEFTASVRPDAGQAAAPMRVLAAGALDAGFVTDILAGYDLGADWEDQARDAAGAARAIADQLSEAGWPAGPQGAVAEFLPGVFYRN